MSTNWKIRRDNSIIEEGTFTILHDDYIEKAQEYKYCIVCNTMKPLEFFSPVIVLGSRNRQGECETMQEGLQFD